MGKTDSVSRWWLWVAVGILSTVALPVLADEDETPELDVPYVPTHEKAVDAMLKLAKVTGEDYVMDLGCGDGRIVVAAASKYKARGMGVDLDPQRIRESNENAKEAGVTDRVTFKLADIMDTDVREATVVTLFLLESVNVQLRPKLFAELKPGGQGAAPQEGVRQGAVLVGHPRARGGHVGVAHQTLRQGGFQHPEAGAGVPGGARRVELPGRREGVHRRGVAGREGAEFHRDYWDGARAGGRRLSRGGRRGCSPRHAAVARRTK
jgi:SAM-dependent methyltransferase